MKFQLPIIQHPFDTVNSWHKILNLRVHHHRNQGLPVRARPVSCYDDNTTALQPHHFTRLVFLYLHVIITSILHLFTLFTFKSYIQKHCDWTEYGFETRSCPRDPRTFFKLPISSLSEVDITKYLPSWCIHIRYVRIHPENVIYWTDSNIFYEFDFLTQGWARPLRCPYRKWVVPEIFYGTIRISVHSKTGIQFQKLAAGDVPDYRR